MIAGIPGTGLGGLFYLLCALWMPFRELYLIMRGRRNASRWRFLGLQAGFAVMIITGIVFTSWLLGPMLPLLFNIDVSTNSDSVILVLRVLPILLPLTVLFSLLLGVQVLSLIIRRWGPRGQI